ncbi:glycosyltransferase family 4 protein [Adhaeretor mobilis]|uniref:Glycogen synthase n=1 Tax=Adhaeretor mobilis TaxID=1930276 RepID=A0A517MVU8_9BACT|nr:glycosyltransferase family 4 protein [Adhaeretor mobilis]QDS98999.1 Glycogen synthase [Adhaeretor mobilis]
MKVLQLYNQYRSLHGGEETVVLMTDALLKRRGHETQLLMRSSRGLDASLLGKMKAFKSAFYNRDAYAEVAASLQADRPDVVHVHNLYPLFSPSVLDACTHAGVPVVMTNHNYLLTCPTTHHLRNGKVCEKCIGGKEIHCALNNCRGSWAESVAYAARSAYARRKRSFSKNVSQFIVLTDFAKRQLLRGDYDPHDINEQNVHVLPNMVELDDTAVDPSQNNYFAYSGRMSYEKGVDVLLEAMRSLPDVTLKLAGQGPLLDELRESASENCEFLGQLNSEEMREHYRGARGVIIPSRNFEGCPLVVSEAMNHGIPLVVSEIGGLPDLVGSKLPEGQQCGRSFPTDDSAKLAAELRDLWDHPEKSRQLGESGRKRALCHFSEGAYYQGLMKVYAAATGRSVNALSPPNATKNVGHIAAESLKVQELAVGNL